MGIQINGQTDTVASTTSGGSVTINPANLPSIRNIYSTGISTFTSGPVLIGSGTSTGTASQPLQVTGGAYVSGDTGIGVTNPDVLFHLNGTNAYPASSGSTPTGYLGLRRKAQGGTHGLYVGVAPASPWGSWLQSQDANNLTTNYPLLLNPNGGNVGVGTINPSQKLEVVGGEIKAGRVDSSYEGGQVTFGRSTDNASAWYIDVYGNTSTPSLRFVDVSSASVRASIDGSGIVTVPYQPCFLAFRSGTQTYSASNTIIFNDEVFDQGSNYNSSTGIFTAPVTGRYLFLTTVLVQSSTTGYEYDIELSTSNRGYFGAPGRTEYQLGTSWGDGYIAHAVQQIADMDANDTAIVRYVSFGGGSIYGGGGWTRFSGYLLC
jgi:hypothetical protein